MKGFATSGRLRAGSWKSGAPSAFDDAGQLRDAAEHDEFLARFVEAWA